jgi:hypothetical protein
MRRAVRAGQPRRALMLLVAGLLSLAWPVQAQMITGSYTGDGQDNRQITGLPFAPDVVIVKGDTNQLGIVRTSTMTGDNAKELAKTALLANLVQSLDTNGFTVGNDARVNANTVTYYWIAFHALPGRLKVGSYAGTGSNQSITGVGFSPECVIVVPESADETNATSIDMIPFARQFDAEAGNTNRITSLDADGFTVGGGGQTGGSGKTYDYIAWNAVAGRVATGSYVGDGNDDRNITSVGFAPGWVVVMDDA